MPFDGADLAQGACFDFFRDGRDGWGAAALEANVYALCRLDSFRDFERLFCLRDVDAYGFFAVDVFAGGDCGLQVLDMEEGRRGDLDEIDIFGSG